MLRLLLDLGRNMIISPAHALVACAFLRLHRSDQRIHSSSQSLLPQSSKTTAVDDALKSKDQRIQALLDDVVMKQAELDKISRELHGLRVS